ncbi:MAG TPA: DUF1854 domain-containing protein [Paenibacillus sp.]|uniref:DUF1854 domain-containing protein n=1 Tax=Paenibacillus sp. TaxID=58172 RepID=UPI002CF1602B|nr:DUF1854 domain-containing protein [Paenibacillus sp.]HUC90411.1 DUF1854 domain-containing protein [Paenibacillus sp.]
MADTYDIRIFSPDDVFFSRGPGGVFQGVVDGKPYDELLVYRAFSFRYTSEYISIRDVKGEELGIVRDIAGLFEESARELEKELLFRYFLPRVTRVDSVKSKSDLWLWELQTHLGATRMAMRNLQRTSAISRRRQDHSDGSKRQTLRDCRLARARRPQPQAAGRSALVRYGSR